MARYWVGGSGNWNDTTHWSDTDGGSSGFSVPGTGDDVKFTASSGGGTCTVNVAASCKSLDFSGYTGTLAGSSAIACLGDLTFAATQAAPTYSGTISLTGTASGKKITSGGRFPANANLTVNGGGGAWTMQDALAFKIFTLTNGTFDTGTFQLDITDLVVSSNTNTRVLTITNSTINITSTTTTAVGCAGTTYTNLTVNASGSIINLSKTAGHDFNGGTKTWGTLNIIGTAPPRFSESCTFAVLTANNRTEKWPMRITAGKTITVSGTFTMSGTYSGGTLNRGLLTSATAGSAATLNAAVVSLSYLIFRDITGAGAAAPFTGTDLHDTRGNSQITFSSPRSLTWKKNTGNSNDETKWASAGVTPQLPPGPNDSATFDNNSFDASSQTMTANHLYWGGITVNGTANNPSLRFGELNLFGSLSLDNSSYSMSGVVSFNMASSASVNLKVTKSGGVDAYISVGFCREYVNNSSATYYATGTFTMDGDVTLHSNGYAFSIQGGTFNAGTHSVLANSISIIAGSGATVTCNMGSGTWKIRSNPGSAAAFMVGATTSTTLNCETSTVEIADTTTAAFVFTGGGKTYNIFTYSGGGSGKSIKIVGDNTFAQFNVTGTDKTVKFTAASTQTISALSVAGTAGHPNILQGFTSANWNLIVTGSASADYCTVSYSQASGAATPIADTHGTNGGNNTGWKFVEGGTANPSFLMRMI